MRTDIETASCQTVNRLPAEERCPFYRPETETCRAALSGVRFEWRRRRNHCTSEDHDDCTVFLGKILRSSLPKARLEPWPLGEK